MQKSFHKGQDEFSNCFLNLKVECSTVLGQLPQGHGHHTTLDEHLGRPKLKVFEAMT